MKELEIKVEGMVCNGCENRVQNSLKNVSGVESVIADYVKGIVKIKANDSIDRKVLEDKIDDIGFVVVKEN